MGGLSLSLTNGLSLRSRRYGPELITNGSFDTDTTGWAGVSATLSASGGECVITADGAGSARASQTITTVAGRSYRITAVMRRGTTVNNVTVLVSGISESSAITSTTPSTVTHDFVATGTSAVIRPGAAGLTAAGETAMVASISAKQIL